MVEPRFELLIAPTPGAVPVRLALAQKITSIGSGTDADVKLYTVPAEWAVVDRGESSVIVRVLATGERHELAPGDRVTVSGVTLGLALRRVDPGGGRAATALETLAAALAEVESPDRAVAQLLAGAMAASGAETGAVIVSEGGAYRVAVARNAAGEVLHDAASLLSDTIVRDVLEGSSGVVVEDAASSERYASVPSVASLRLRSVLCVPMRLEGRTLGALFLGKQDRGDAFDERAVAEIKVLAALAVPFMAQLRRARAPATPSADLLLGDSEPMERVRRVVARVAPTDLSLLVLGPSGTGKELVARAIHAASPRAGRTMVAINCAAVPASLLDAELFGYRKGAFTGAASDRKGLIEAAHGSTLFLDEIGDMPPPMQAALLRVLEQREVKRLGETQVRAVDFRLIAATNRDLEAEVVAGTFREDLLFRLREMTIELPPLSARGEDVLLLARFFLRQTEAQLALPARRLGPAAAARLQAHPWPGNVRELRATMRRVAILAEGEVIEPEDLQLGRGGAARATGDAGPGHASELGDLDRPLAEARDEFVRRYVAAAVERCGGNREEAARMLGIGVRTLYRYL